jgi:hypothetical protein
MVVNGPFRSGDFFKVGSSVSFSQRALRAPVRSATVFMRLQLYDLRIDIPLSGLLLLTVWTFHKCRNSFADR